LAQAVHDGLAAPHPAGVTATVNVTSHLFDSVASEAAGPLLKGGPGRLWISGGKLRLEVQGDNGDVQLVLDQGKGLVYDHNSGTAYRFDVSHRAATPDKPDPNAAGAAPSLADIEAKLADLTKHATVDGPQPTVAADQPAYSVRLAPKDPGGLLGAVQVAWDAVRGAPLKLALYARGSSTPALQIEVTHISYGPVDPAMFSLSPPAGTKVTDLTGSGTPDAADPKAPAGAKAGPEPSLASLPFAVSHPPTLANRARTSEKAVGKDGALVLYGKGADTIAVLERPVSKDAAAAKAKPADAGRQLFELPAVDLAGVKATELVTPLGGFIRFERDGISYTVAGSQPRDVLEAAARGL
jgi:hypothetical protein